MLNKINNIFCQTNATTNCQDLLIGIAFVISFSKMFNLKFKI